MEDWLARADLPEPFCLVWCLINPHDVLGYPASYEEGGYARGDVDDVRVPLPRTLDEDLRDKPTVQAMTKLGLTSYLGALDGREEQQRYVDFYAHLHREADAKVGRLLAALGDPATPSSLRSRTVIVRTSDHGELGLSHGGLRQKIFNAYEESIRVPLVVSSPALFPAPRESDALVSLVDVVPTLLGLAGAPARPAGSTATTSGRCCAASATASATRCCSPTTTTRRGRRSRRRRGSRTGSAACATARWKYAVYLDPNGAVAPEYELYDLEADPDEALNLVDKAHRARADGAGAARARRACTACWSGCAPPAGRRTPRAAAGPGRRRLGARAPALTRRARGGAAGRLRRASAEGVERRRHAGARRREARHPPGGAELRVARACRAHDGVDGVRAGGDARDRHRDPARRPEAERARGQRHEVVGGDGLVVGAVVGLAGRRVGEREEQRGGDVVDVDDVPEVRALADHAKRPGCRRRATRSSAYQPPGP